MMFTYKIKTYSKRKQRSIINFMYKKKEPFWFIDEGKHFGFWVRTEKDRKLERFLKEKKFKFTIDKYYAYGKDEGSMISEHFNFFQKLFMDFCRIIKNKNNNYYEEFMERLVHVLSMMKYQNFSSLGKQGMEAQILSTLALRRAAFAGRINLQSEMAMENGRK